MKQRKPEIELWYRDFDCNRYGIMYIYRKHDDHLEFFNEYTSKWETSLLSISQFKVPFFGAVKIGEL